jgi:hypothetical protein
MPSPTVLASRGRRGLLGCQHCGQAATREEGFGLKNPETERRREADTAKRLALWLLGGLVLLGFAIRMPRPEGWIGYLMFLASLSIGASIFGGLLLFMVLVSRLPKRKPDNPSGPVTPGGTAETRGERSQSEAPVAEEDVGLRDPETKRRREADAAKRLFYWALGGLVLLCLVMSEGGLWCLLVLALGAVIVGGLVLFLMAVSSFPKKKPDNPSGPGISGGTAESRGELSQRDRPPAEAGIGLKGPATERRREADAAGGVVLWVLGGLLLLGFVKNLDPAWGRGWLLLLAIFGGLFLLMMVVSNFPKKKPDNPSGPVAPGGTAETRGERSRFEKPPGS